MPNIRKVLIVGGGSSGWMAAAYLSKKLSFLDITLIESKTVGTIGVGESTLGHINKFLDALEIKDQDWMKCWSALQNFNKVGLLYFNTPRLVNTTLTEHNTV